MEPARLESVLDGPETESVVPVRLAAADRDVDGDAERLIQRIRAAVIGDDIVLEGLLAVAGWCTPTTRRRGAR
jgi:hypothetical protein